MKCYVKTLLLMSFLSIISLMSFARDDLSKLSKIELKKKLTPLQYKVTQENGTEQPFKNEYWDNKREGIYVDIISGEPLFSSLDKFKSGTGWPSFTKSIQPNAIKTKKDRKFFMTRIEVRSNKADSHLGHVFEDGPQDRGGLRFCMNSASLKFIPKEELVKQGYGEFTKMFSEKKKAYFAGGCFWGMEYYFRKLEGVTDTEVGYMGGDAETAAYNKISTGKTGHAETLEVTYDPKMISFRELVTFFFRLHDPTTLNRQKNDLGPQYRSAIFPTNQEETSIIVDVIKLLKEHKVFDEEIVTKIESGQTFYRAEEYHQDYLRKNPNGYNCHLLGKELPFK